LGAAGGYKLASFGALAAALASFTPSFEAWPWVGVAAGGLIGWGVGWWAGERLRHGLEAFGALVQRTPLADIVTGVLGAAAGLALAILATATLPEQVPLVGAYGAVLISEIGRASCRERVGNSGGGGT